MSIRKRTTMRSARSNDAHAEQQPPPPPACVGGFFLGVLPGQTLSAIATRLGLSVQQIVAANPQITDPNLIFSGQLICIPEPQPIPCGPESLIVITQAGTTFFGLATLFQSTVENIQLANPGVNPRNIPIGALLCVPSPLVPQRIPVLPCCITLASREFGTLGTALLEPFGQLGQFNAVVAVADLPLVPRPRELQLVEDPELQRSSPCRRRWARLRYPPVAT